MPPWKQAVVGVIVLGAICAFLAWRADRAGRAVVVRDNDVYETARLEAERFRAAAEARRTRRAPAP